MQELIKQLDDTIKMVYNFVSKIVDEFKLEKKPKEPFVGRTRGRR